MEGTDLGQLTKLVVTIDGAGVRPAWNLDHILVCVECLVEGVGVSGHIELAVIDLPPFHTVPHTYSDPYSQVHRDASLTDSLDAAVYFPCRQWFDKERGMAKQLFPMARAAEGNMLDFSVKVSAIHSVPPPDPH